ncbi:hypothetical protein NicSoilC12_34990 [Arthrobacter sp. NicSoilC12]|nr:hypothetical protein NicSoilC12_34990 [Arthrobacter sp. NicSoilC12]
MALIPQSLVAEYVNLARRRFGYRPAPVGISPARWGRVPRVSDPIIVLGATNEVSDRRAMTEAALTVRPKVH